jgi:DNA-binding protein
MKRQVQETGIRKWFGGDWLSLQAEPFKVIDGHYEQYGNMIIKGCEIINNQADINPGIVGLWGKDEANNDIYKVAEFSGLQAAASWPVYLVLDKEEEKRLYDTGIQKNVAVTYKATPEYALPTGEYLIINQDGNNKTYREALQSSSYRFVTDAQISDWNSKAEGVHGHAAADVTDSTTKRFVTDAQISDWNSKAEGVHGHAAADVTDSTTKRFVTDAQISDWNSKAEGVHGHAAADITESTTRRFVTDTEKLGFWSGSSTVLTTTKKVGVGIASAVAKFTVLSGVSNNEIARFAGTVEDRGLQISSFAVGGTNESGFDINARGTGEINALQFSTGGNARMHIDGAGKVGFGTIVPYSKVDIVETNAGGAITGATLRNSSSSSLSEIDLKLVCSTSNASNVGGLIRVVRTNASALGDSDMHLATTCGGTLVDRISMLANGNVGIATAEPLYKLDVNGSARFNGNIGFFNTTPIAKKALTQYPSQVGIDTTWGGNEIEALETTRDSLQEVIDALKAYGLLS